MMACGHDPEDYSGQPSSHFLSYIFTCYLMMAYDLDYHRNSALFGHLSICYSVGQKFHVVSFIPSKYVLWYGLILYTQEVLLPVTSDCKVD